MATKKPVKTVKKPSETTKKVKKGTQYACRVCGLVVTVNEACGCGEAHELICCGKVMKGK